MTVSWMRSVIRVEQQPCWILHRRPWRESSLLLEIFSRDYGRAGLVAKGARGSRSAWRGLTEPFAPLLASWTRRGELGTTTGLESAGKSLALTGRSLWCGLYVNELVLKLLGRDDQAPALFQAYETVLDELLFGSDSGFALRRFELALLTELGVAPDFRLEALSGDAIEADGLYHLRAESGLVAIARRADQSGSGVFQGRVALALAGDHPWNPDIARQARDLMRLLLDHHLDGRSLKTRDLFRRRPVKR
jgi:DNA repair protein RecO (recombination protein O)